jgi:hypothetical protein
MFEPNKVKRMRSIRILLPLFFSMVYLTACNNSDNGSASPGVDDSTSSNPVSDEMDHHPDERQHIPITDSSNTIGTDTINSSESTPNTGTQKSYNDSSKQ